MSEFSPQMRTLITLLARLVPQVLEAFNISGCAVGVVYRDEAYAQGYGHVHTGRRANMVNAHTRFQIGSLTKAFITALLAIFVEKGLIRWDDLITKHLPDFRLSKPEILGKLTIYHLAAHIGGLPPYGGDLFIYPPTGYTIEQILQRLEHLPLDERTFGQYAYSNLGYTILGAVLEKVSGRKVQNLLAEYIFMPLGMTDTIAPLSAFAGDNVALPHVLVDSRLKQIKPYTSILNLPVGGIGSSAENMKRWIVACLNKGYGLFLPTSWETLTAGQAPMMLSKPPTGLGPLASTYRNGCLGWEERDYGGYRTLGFAGSLFGYSSRIVLIPNNIGVVVLANRESIGALSTILYGTIDHLLGRKPFAWLRAWQNWERNGERATRQAIRDALSTCNQQSLPNINNYVGLYRSPWYGNVRVTGGNFFTSPKIHFLETPGLYSNLQHCTGNIFLAPFQPEMNLFAKVTLESANEIGMELVAGDNSYYDLGRLGLRRVS